MNESIKNIFIIILSTIISSVLALSVDLDRLELGALANLFFPSIIGVLTIGLYFLGVKLFGLNKNFFLTVCVLINLATGIFFRFFDF